MTKKILFPKTMTCYLLATKMSTHDYPAGSKAQRVQAHLHSLLEGDMDDGDAHWVADAISGLPLQYLSAGQEGLAGLAEKVIAVLRNRGHEDNDKAPTV